MKNYTDIEQSKKLAEILPLESADGFWEYHDKWYSEGDEWEGYEDYPRAEPYFEYTRKENEWKEDKSDVPCWSLASLLGVLPDEITDADDVYRNMFFHLKGKYIIQYPRLTTLWPSLLSVEADNPVDACVDMIIKLNELKLL